MDIEKTSGYIAVFFGIIGSWGLYRQVKLIWTSKSVASVSGMWTITFLVMFASFLIYGTQKSSFPMIFQGWLRVGFSIPLVIGFWKYGGFTRKHWILTGLYSILLISMASRKFSPIIFVGLSYVGIVSSFVQAWTIYAEKSRGKVAVELQVIYLLASICWFVYGLVRKDFFFLSTSIGFFLSYSSNVIMWWKYPATQKGQLA